MAGNRVIGRLCRAQASSGLKFSPLASTAQAMRAFLAATATLPGVLWAAFEMYGLTMRGQQMLFSMNAHVMPPPGFGTA